MDERATLLEQLKIDRNVPVEVRHRAWPWWLAGAGCAGAGAVAAWLTLAATGAVPNAATGAPPAGSSVAVAPAARAATAPLANRSMLDASGYVVARREATVSSKLTAKVVAVLIEEGRRVEQDQVIAQLDDSNARAQLAVFAARRDQALAALDAAVIDFANVSTTFARDEALHAQRMVSAQSFDEAKARYDAARARMEVARQTVKVAEADVALAERNLADTVVRAPFAGVVTVKAAQEGEMVSPVSGGGGFTRTGIGTIVDMESLEVEVDVSESFIERVHAGQDVAVKLNAYPDWQIAGRVLAIIPTADRAKATVTVRIALDEKDERVVPDMGVRVSFLSERAQQ